MDTDDDLFADLIESVTLDVLARLRDDADARYAFFKGFLALALEPVGDRGPLGASLPPTCPATSSPDRSDGRSMCWEARVRD